MSALANLYADVVGDVYKVFNVTSLPYSALVVIVDDTADYTAAITQALEDANSAGGGVVYFPAGTYNLVSGELPIYSNTVWLGDGIGVTKIVADSTTASGIVVQPFTNSVEALESISFIGITFEVSESASSSFSIISIMSSGHSRINFYECEFTGQTAASAAIYFGGQPQFGDGYATTTTGPFSVPAVGSSSTLTLNFGGGDRIGKLQLANGQIVVGPQQYQGKITNIDPTPSPTTISYTLTIETVSLGAATAGEDFAEDARWATTLQSTQCGFHGCLIKENSMGGEDFAALALYSHSQATIDGCTFTTNSGLYGSPALLFYGFNSDCVITKNLFTANGNTDLQVNCVRAIVKNNMFKRNSTPTGQICIKVSNNLESIFSGNIFESNGSNVAAITVVDYEVIEYTPTWVAATTQCSIEGNTFNGTYYAVNFLPYDSESEPSQAYNQISIRENRCTSPVAAFVYIDNSVSGAEYTGISDIVIADNVVLPMTSGAYGVHVVAESSTSIVGLRITRNTFGSQESPGGIGGYCDVLENVYFVGNNCLNCTTAFSLAGGATASLAKSNPGFNPQGYVSSTVPTSGDSLSNPFAYPVKVYINGGTVSAVAVNGETVASGTDVVVQLSSPSDELTITYSIAPTLAWFGL